MTPIPGRAGEREEPPGFVAPMLCTAAGAPPEPWAEWAFEMKWDGVRALVESSPAGVRIWSRRGDDMRTTYPEFTAIVDASKGSSVLLDGEIVRFGDDGAPSFSTLQRRMQVRDAARAARLAASEPAVFLAFDVLHLDGSSTRSATYAERRAVLEGLGLEGPAVLVPPSFSEVPGATVLEAAAAQGLEGIVAKRLDSLYEVGRRSRAWTKVKHFSTQEVLIGGWSAGTGSRSGTLGALLVGVPGPEGLRYAGKVGTGFSDDALADLRTRLRPLERPTSPFVDAVPPPISRGATWADPVLVGEVRFTEWTRDRRLRQPAWRGLRPDKAPGEVREES
jgi:bifunctional non-homologous end joining protein LigD